MAKPGLDAPLHAPTPSDLVACDDGIARPRWAAVDPLQPDLFAQGEPVPAEPEPHPAVEKLAAIDPDSLTPRQALEVLYTLKALTR